MSDNSIVGILLAIVVGLAFAGIGGGMYYSQQQAVQAHEPTEATVLETSIDAETTDDDTSYHARITYEYTVDGRTYTSDNVRPAGFSKGWGSRSAAAEFLEKYQPGSTVTAYYDPKSPDEAFLVKKTSKVLLVFAGVGGLVAVLGVVGFFKKLVGLVT